VLVGLIIILPLVLIALNKSQNLSKKASINEKIVNFVLFRGETKKQQGEIFKVNIGIQRTVKKTVAISGVEAVIDVDNPLSVSSQLRCQYPFDGVSFTQVKGQRVSIMCTVKVNSAPVVLNTDTPQYFSVLKLKGNVPADKAFITFRNIQVIKAETTGEVKNIANQGKRGVYKIVSGETVSKKNHDPVGNLESVNCNQIVGWAGDADDINQPVEVAFYVEGKRIRRMRAFRSREKAICNIIKGNSDVEKKAEQTCNHGFSFATPRSLKDGETHLVYGYAVNLKGTQGKKTKNLWNSPKAIKCASINK